MKGHTADRILEFLMEQKPAMTSFLNQLVRLESPTQVPSSQKPVLNLISQQLSSVDFYVAIMPGYQTGGYLVARPSNRKKRKAVQLLVGHCDTVWPVGTIEEMPVTVEDGKMKGPGVFDMKAGIVQIIFALKAIRQLGLPFPMTPVIIINSDEEKGSRESTLAISRFSRIASRAFVLEPPYGPEGKLKTERKGLGRFDLEIIGIPSHAGLDPARGASAILELAHQVQRLFGLNDHKKGITVNVGMIEGGTQANIIAPNSRAIVDVRVRSRADGKTVTNKILALQPVHPDVQLRITGGIGRPPMERTERNRQLWLAAKQAGKSLGLELEEVAVGGGSDGNTTSQYTATLDGLGTTGDGAHAKHEYIFLDKLLERTALLTLLIMMEGI